MRDSMIMPNRRAPLALANRARRCPKCGPLFRRAAFPLALCSDRQVSGLLEQPLKLRLWSEAHGSIRVQEGEPTSQRVRWKDLTL